jgi:hypothetical protein
MNLFLYGAGSTSTIRRNKVTSAWPFAIGIQGPRSVNPSRAPIPIRVRIEDNEIRVNALARLTVSHGLTVSPVENLVLRNNTFHVGPDVKPSTQAAVLSGCRTVTAEGNTFHDKRQRVDKGVLQIDGTPGNEVTVEDNVFRTQPGVRHVYHKEPAK